MANENNSSVVKADKQLVFLRRLVKTLGIILIVGTVLVITLAINQLINAAHKSATSKSCQDVMTDNTGELSGTILAMHQDERYLLLALKDGKKQKIIWADPCSGKVLRTMYLTK